jgi:hypothetical protein
MFSATCNSQHCAGDYSIALYKKGAERKKECGTVLSSVGETRKSRFELSSCGTQSWWIGRLFGFLRVLNKLMIS